ncbi:hypothetical protein LO772_30515 [Yinghuangia sp. ASG 101]|uniref:hypothetical protein n=1 Tax=Yinghuangia sp. ASG 101 TaxID=2896848 RepID=UPI001E4F0CF8|nr:hypothetical protein [Yinghuangia sp. ASG 101]UGQ11093.1 hypothetical protein LO772_30515 [Yinghuangia sp. ASG 101]
MTCRTRRDAGLSPRRHPRCSPAGRGRGTSAARLHSSPGPTPPAAADLVTRVAAIVPAPGKALCADDNAWEAFSAFLDEAARLVADALGHADIRTLRALLDSPLGEDLVAGLLIERALTRLQDGGS